MILMSAQIPTTLPSVSSSTISTVDAGSVETGSVEIWLTDEILFNYQRCSRRVFLDRYGDRQQRGSPPDYLQKLRQDSYSHQREVLSQAPFHEPSYPRRDWAAGAIATTALMQQGVDRIANGVLQMTLENGVHLVSCPDLLVKQPGYSIWGDWLYAPIDIRLGKRPKLDYQVAVAFHTYVLAAVQGMWAENCWLILRQRGTYAISLVDVLPRMEEILQACMETLLLQQEPEVFISHSRCDLCHWFSHCYTLAHSERHLSLLPGVTPSRYTHLKALQLKTLEDIAIAHPKQLESLPGFGAQVAQRLVKQAQATLQNQAIAHIEAAVLPSVPLLSKIELPTADVELYFDIEAAPEQNLVYLHGVLVAERLTQTETFYPLLAECQADEGKAWNQFLELVWRYPHAPIFHFCPYEAQTVRRLGECYGTSSHLIEPLLRRFVDLHERVTRVAILPVESYALKPIARWLGFNWRDSEANGAQSICWYDQWLTTGDRTYLEAILRYNEDDCRATYRVKDWLVQFTQSD
jgi:predicted RecB family nuclease